MSTSSDQPKMSTLSDELMELLQKVRQCKAESRKELLVHQTFQRIISNTMRKVSADVVFNRFREIDTVPSNSKEIEIDDNIPSTSQSKVLNNLYDKRKIGSRWPSKQSSNVKDKGIKILGSEGSTTDLEEIKTREATGASGSKNQRKKPKSSNGKYTRFVNSKNQLKRLQRKKPRSSKAHGNYIRSGKKTKDDGVWSYMDMITMVIDFKQKYPGVLDECSYQEVIAQFNEEEALGRFIDLQAFHCCYINSQFGKEVDYYSYLQEFSHFEKIHIQHKDRKYKKYLEKLVAYLSDFIMRSRPLLNLTDKLAKVTSDEDGKRHEGHKKEIFLLESQLRMLSEILYGVIRQTQRKHKNWTSEQA